MDKKRKNIEFQLEQLLTKMEKYLSPDLKSLIDLSYNLSKRKTENIEVTTSGSTSVSNHFNA